MKKLLFALIIIIALTASLSFAGERGPVQPSQKDKCPVCGMFVYKYPDWTAGIVFKDGSYAVFDGPKDMFTCYFDLEKYMPGKQRGDIESLFVTDYYDVKPLDARRAWYVTGSDVYGPMGKELIPFKTESDARQFLKDHQGKKALGYKEVTQKVVKELE
jgi:nitrous oxide reductase accessory protein NosL